MYDLDRFMNMLDRSYVPSRYLDGRDMEYRFWFRALLMDLNSMLDFQNLPKSWPENFLKLCLYSAGFVGVFQSYNFGDKDDNNVTFNPCTFGGYDFYYQPAYIIVTNPKLQKKFTIDKDCVLLKINEDYCGIFDIVDYYATKLAHFSTALNMAAANAKIPAIFTCNTEAEKRTIEAAYDDTQSGKPIMIVKNPENSTIIMPTNNIVEAVYKELKQSYIGTELIDNIHQILNMWYETIGYPVTVDKNAHILNQEADFQFAQSSAKVKTWTNMLNIGFDKINNMFGTRMEVKYACEDEFNRNAEVSESAQQEY